MKFLNQHTSDHTAPQFSTLYILPLPSPTLFRLFSYSSELICVAVRGHVTHYLRAIMEAVWIRQKGAIDFAAYYESLCALESICPVSSIRTSAKDGQVNCKCDRLRRADWHPLLNALRINKSLSLVCFHTKWQQCYASGA